MPELRSGFVKIINATPHAINFRDEDGTEFEIPPCGFTINALAQNEDAGKHAAGVDLVRVRFTADQQAEACLEELERENPGAVIVGSMIAAQAFPGRVVAMIAATGYERRPPSEKRMRPDRFTTF